MRASIFFENRWTELVARWILGLVFIYGCYHKIFAPAHFAKIIYGYYLFPQGAINLIAIILPFLEFFAGLALILGIYPRSAALILNGLLLAFIAAISINLIRGVEFDCGCFSFGGGGHTSSAAQLLVRDLLYFLLGLEVLFFEGQRLWSLLSTGSILKNRNGLAL